MRLKYRLKTALQFIAFAFYPKTTLIACVIFSVIVIAILGLLMGILPKDSNWYNIIFALTTGAAASFFVSFVVEMMNNYRHNKLAWYELQDYYSVVTDYESMKQVLMQHTSPQRAELKAQEEFIAAGGVLENDEKPKDIIQSTWNQLPNVIPVLKRTLEEKKQFLSNGEINELSAIMYEYSEIRNEIKTQIMMSPFLYNALNHPDEEILKTTYSSNVLEDLPAWMRKHIASNASQESLERLVDTILSDNFLLEQFMKNYDISQHGLENYQSEDEDYEPVEFDEDFSEPEDEEEFKSIHNEFDKQMEEENRPFVSWHISHCCASIVKSIDSLEKAILKQPYYSIRLEYDRNAEKEFLDDPVSSMSYEYEKKRLEKIIERQNNDKETCSMGNDYHKDIIMCDGSKKA